MKPLHLPHAILWPHSQRLPVSTAWVRFCWGYFTRWWFPHVLDKPLLRHALTTWWRNP